MRYRKTLGLLLWVSIFALLAVLAAPEIQAGASELTPDITFTPASFSVAMRQGESGFRTFGIQNRGSGPLQWAAVLGDDSPWATLSASSGTVRSKWTQTVKIYFDAGVLPPGTYSSTLSLSSDDPDTPDIERPITFKVYAAPVVAFTPPALVCNPAFVGGRSRTAFRVTNTGSAPLVISSSLPLSPTFVCAAKFPVSVPSGASKDLEVEFRPQAEGTFNANVVLITNTVSRYFYIPVSGASVFGPVLKVTPPSVAVTMNPGVQKVLTFDLGNASKGRADLVWQAEVETPAGQKWLSLENAHGSLPVGAKTQMSLNLDTSGVEAGTYAIKVLIRSNDPLRPEMRVPVSLRVNRLSVLDVSPNNASFPESWVGRAENVELTIDNAGNVPIVISNVTTSGPEIKTGFLEQITLKPGESISMAARYVPTQTGAFAGSVTIQTRDPKIGSVTVPITASVVRPAAIAINPDHITVTAPVGQTFTRDLTVANSGGGALNWAATLQNVTLATSPQGTLGEVLQRLDSHPTLLTSAIQDRFDFSGGVTGTSINNGGSQMYNLGNKIGTNLSASMPYSDGVITAHAGVGANGRYFTRKHAGLFLFAGDLVGVTRFSISGTLGASGQGVASGAVLTRTIAGITYKGFFKRVYGTSSPSVNHLIITADGVGVGDAFTTDTHDDKHDLNGIYSASTRVYYLLFATDSGGFVSDAAAADMMRIFLENYVHPTSTSWLSINQPSGVTPGASNATETVTFDTRALAIGTYKGTVRFTSNALVSSTVNVPIILNVSASVGSIGPVDDPPAGVVESVQTGSTASSQGAAVISLAGGTIGSSSWQMLRSVSSGLLLLTQLQRASAPVPIASGVAAPSSDGEVTVDLDGDGVADVASSAQRITLRGEDLGVVTEVLTYARRAGLADTALILECSGDNGQTWQTLIPDVDYAVTGVVPLTQDVSEQVELRVPRASRANWRFRFVGAPGN